MTPEDMERLVAQADFDGLAKACESLSEADRRKLSTTAAKLESQIEKARMSNYVQDDTQPLPASLARLRSWVGDPDQQTLNKINKAARYAMLAVCPLSKVKRIMAGSHYSDEANQCLVKILSDRQPDWIDEWIGEKLKGEWKQIDWLTLRALIKKGVCQKPASDGYLELMASSMPGSWHEDQGRRIIPLSEKLLAEPELLEEEVWRLFKIDTDAFKFNYYYDRRSSSKYETWPIALKRLVDEGHLDRERILDATLSGLSMGFKSNSISGYAKFHDSLEPTAAEVCARQQTYLDLISSQTPAVVTFALRNLKLIDKEKKLDAPAFVRAVSTVLCGRQKAQPKAALMLLKKIAGRHPELGRDVAVAASEGLTHEAPDVQERSLKLLDSLSVESLNGARAIIAERLVDISASCKSLADGLVSKLGIDSVGQQSGEEAEELEQLHTDLIARARLVETSWRGIAGIDKAIEAVRKGELPPPLDFDLHMVPVLTGIDPVTPIETVDELIESVSHAVEEVDSADEVERILDGISRLCDQKSVDFERITGPLVKRIIDRAAGDRSRGLIDWGSPANLLQVLGSWLRLDGTFKTIVPGSEWAGLGPVAIWDARLFELANRVLEQKACPLLATPTHMYGWIDPRRFVERVLVLQKKNIEIPKLDLIQALLRLAPDHRDGALADAESIGHDYGRAIRWALGGEEGPAKKDKGAAEVWLAAGRCRTSRGRLTVLSNLGLDLADPDSIESATYHWRSYATSHKVDDKTYYHSNLEIKVLPKGGKGENSDDQPTAALHGRDGERPAYYMDAAWLFEWAGMIWPANPDAMLASGIEAMMSRIDDPSSMFEPNYAYLHPLFMPDLPLSEMACLALWIGLIGRDADVRGTAIDVLIQAIQDGRAHPGQFGEVLVKLAAGDCIKMNRVSASLAEVARLSSSHARFAYHVLDLWLASLDSLPRDGHFALELLVELKTQLGLPLNERGLNLLNSIKGSSKSAKAAKILRACNMCEPSPAAQAASLAQLEARVERAERWASTNL